MTGAGKKKDKAARRMGQHSMTINTEADAPAPNDRAISNIANDGALDGPKTPDYGFRPGEESQALAKYSRLELPPEAFNASSVIPHPFLCLTVTPWSKSL
jgi:hypothetical protein